MTKECSPYLLPTLFLPARGVWTFLARVNSEEDALLQWRTAASGEQQPSAAPRSSSMKSPTASPLGCVLPGGGQIKTLLQTDTCSIRNAVRDSHQSPRGDGTGGHLHEEDGRVSDTIHFISEHSTVPLSLDGTDDPNPHSSSIYSSTLEEKDCPHLEEEVRGRKAGRAV